ncbi:MAG: beta-propeller fold lactonase family protein [Nitrospiraceae bacterium]|nr:beta-propeller fold lactonase family protein [Nitrospiraceae bacterium]
MSRGATNVGGVIGQGLAMVLLSMAAVSIPACGGDDGGGDAPGGGGGGGATSQFAYVANHNTNNVSLFSVNSAGALTVNGPPVAAGIQPHSINVDPAGRFVYVSNHESNFLSAYTINRTTGALSPVIGVPTPGQIVVGDNVHASAFDRTGRFLYVANGTGASSMTAHTVNANGTLTLINGPFPAGTHVHNFTVDPSNRFVYTASDVSNNVHVFSINSTTGGLSPVGGPVAGVGGPLAVVVTADSRFAYVPNNGGLIQAFSIDGTSGALTPLPGPNATVATGSNAHSAVITGDILYVANINSNTITSYRINGTTGVLTPLPTTTTGLQPHYMVVKDGFLYVANYESNNIQRFNINTGTGELTAPVTFNDPAANGPIGIGITSF